MSSFQQLMVMVNVVMVVWAGFASVFNDDVEVREWSAIGFLIAGSNLLAAFV